VKKREQEETARDIRDEYLICPELSGQRICG
jgi:hypothetical protein